MGNLAAVYGVAVDMTRRLLFRSSMALALLTVPVFVGSSCGGCAKKSCVEPGVYLTLGLEPRAATAEICIDSECATLPVQRIDGLSGADQQFALRVNDPIDWTSGRRINLTIDVRDASGLSLARTAEQRTMASLGGNACSPCPSLSYNLVAGDLVRSNAA